MEEYENSKFVSLKSDVGSEVSGYSRASIKIKTPNLYSDADVEAWGQDLEIDENSVALYALHNVKLKASRKFGLQLPGSTSNQTTSSSGGHEEYHSPSPKRFTLTDFHHESTTSHPVSTIKSIQMEKREATPPSPTSSKPPFGDSPPKSNLYTDTHDHGPKVEGREIKQDHDLYALTYGMILGIRVMLKRIEVEIRGLTHGSGPLNGSYYNRHSGGSHNIVQSHEPFASTTTTAINNNSSTNASSNMSPVPVSGDITNTVGPSSSSTSLGATGGGGGGGGHPLHVSSPASSTSTTPLPLIDDTYNDDDDSMSIELNEPDYLDTVELEFPPEGSLAAKPRQTSYGHFRLRSRKTSSNNYSLRLSTSTMSLENTNGSSTVGGPGDSHHSSLGSSAELNQAIQKSLQSSPHNSLYTHSHNNSISDTNTTDPKNSITTMSTNDTTTTTTNVTNSSNTAPSANTTTSVQTVTSLNYNPPTHNPPLISNTHHNNTTNTTNATTNNSTNTNNNNNSSTLTTLKRTENLTITPPHKLPKSFKFKDYMPKVFRVIRALSGIDEGQYMRSVAGDFNYIEFLANSKSGQFFFYSHDGKYMIKTQTKEESRFVRHILPQYVNHIYNNPHSLLVRFYGMHRVKMDFLSSSQTIHFIIMSSVFDTEKHIHIKYDLKGSTVGRITSEQDCQAGAVQKDVNLDKSGRKFRFTDTVIETLKTTLESDAYFLAELKIMDYSLLVGIHESHNIKQQLIRRPSGMIITNKAFSEYRKATRRASTRANFNSIEDNIFKSYHGGVKSAPEVDEIYFLGIIDILQVYNMNKRSETILKAMIGQNSKQISSVNPKYYAKRFVDFILDHTNYKELQDLKRLSIKNHVTLKINGTSPRVISPRGVHINPLKESRQPGVSGSPNNISPTLLHSSHSNNSSNHSIHDIHAVTTPLSTTTTTSSSSVNQTADKVTTHEATTTTTTTTTSSGKNTSNSMHLLFERAASAHNNTHQYDSSDGDVITEIPDNELLKQSFYIQHTTYEIQKHELEPVLEEDDNDNNNNGGGDMSNDKSMKREQQQQQEEVDDKDKDNKE